jgi:hypothetical protein
MKIKSWPLEITITAALWVLSLVYCLFVWIGFWLAQTQNNAALPMAVFVGSTGLLAMQALSFNAYGCGFFAGIVRVTWDREFRERVPPPSLSRGIPQSWQDEALGKRHREKDARDQG